MTETGYEVGIDEVREALICNDQSMIERDLDRYLAKKGITLDKDSMEYRLLRRGFLRQMLEALKIDERRHNGDYSDPYSSFAIPATSPLQSVAAPVTKIQDRTMLSEALDKYISIKSQTWKPSSQKDMIPTLKDFLEMVGDREIRTLNRDHMREYQRIMHHLPSRRTTSLKYKGKSLAQLLNMDIPDDDKLAPKTLKTAFITVRSFIKWLEEEALLDHDRPAKHLNSTLIVLRKQSKADKRRSFTDKELQTLFSPENFTPGTFRNAWQFWVPIIGLYTGARIEELCQLHLADIRQEEGTGIWFFDINSEDEKDVKTEAGKRMVPIHQDLIDLGLLDRVEALRKMKGTIRLFPTLNSRSSTGKLSGAVTQWFTRYRRTCGVGAEKGEKSIAVFHSFRHSLISRCKFMDLSRRKVQEMVGHEQGEFDDVTGRVYEDRYPVQAIYKAVVSKLDFSDVVDLGRLKGTRWVREA